MHTSHLQRLLKATVTKNLEFAEDISVPGYTFNFTADKITNDAPDATIGSIKYTKQKLKEMKRWCL